jgi:DNA polymerase III subunit gamma/tau
LMSGEIQKVLGLLRSQYDSGADPIIIIQDLLELTHWLTALKVTPEAANNVAMAGGDVTRGQELSAGLSMAVLARTWQMLLKGLDEVRKAPMSLAAAEMVLVRIAYVSDLPSPEELAKKLDQRTETSPAPATTGKSGSSSGLAPAMMTYSGASAAPQTVAPIAAPDKSPRAHLSLVAKNDPALEMPPVESLPELIAKKAEDTALQSLEDIIDLLSDRQDIKLKAEVTNFMRLVKFEEGFIEFSPTAGASPDLVAKLGVRLREITGGKWVVKMSATADGAPTIAEKRRHDKAAEISALENHPMIRNIQSVFPGASIREVRNLGPTLDSSDEHDISEEDEFD